METIVQVPDLNDIITKNNRSETELTHLILMSGKSPASCQVCNFIRDYKSSNFKPGSVGASLKATTMKYCNDHNILIIYSNTYELYISRINENIQTIIVYSGKDQYDESIINEYVNNGYSIIEVRICDNAITSENISHNEYRSLLSSERNFLTEPSSKSIYIYIAVFISLLILFIIISIIYINRDRNPKEDGRRTLNNKFFVF